VQDLDGLVWIPTASNNELLCYCYLLSVALTENDMNASSKSDTTVTTTSAVSDSLSAQALLDTVPQQKCGKERVTNNTHRAHHRKCENEAVELDQLLTLVQASRQEHQLYEEDVLRQATLQLAPQLSIDTLGLPPTTLSSLWMGGVTVSPGRLDPTVLRTVLTTTRRQIAKCTATERATATALLDQQSTMDNEESEKAAATTSSSLNLLYMKEQILLFALSNGGNHDFVQLSKEREAEQARSQLLIRQTLPNALEHNAMEPAPTVSRRTVGHSRISIMKRKRAEMNVGHDVNETNVTQNHANSRVLLEKELTESQRTNLRALRLQRQARRRAAMQRQDPNDGHDCESPPPLSATAATSVMNDNEDSRLHHEWAMGDDLNHRPAEPQAVMTLDTAAVAAIPATTMMMVTCPDCETNWTITYQGDETADLSLARHLSQCRGRPSRRSTRHGAATAAAVAVAKSLAAVSDPNTAKTSDKNDTASMNNDTDTDASNDSASTGTDNDFRTSRQRPRSARAVVTRSSSSRNTTRPAVPSNLSVATMTTTTTTTTSAAIPLDDWNAHDYDDRVDDWLEFGLDRMKILRERDVDEVVPGAVEYDGGLLVPAWINNRLFAYQRQGLECLWSWHLQKTGGIIGDEMGLVRPEQPKARAHTHDCHLLLHSHLPFCASG
jgi:hypothetical protein